MQRLPFFTGARACTVEASENGQLSLDNTECCNGLLRDVYRVILAAL